MPALFLVPPGTVFWLITGFWVWMLYDCIKRERYPWVLLLVMLNVVGAALYFFAHWLPERSKSGGAESRTSWARGRRPSADQMRQAEADVINIGKASQYMTLGNLLFDANQTEKAYEAYQQVLEREPENVRALWGAARCAYDLKDYSAAKEHLACLLKKEPEFAYGSASMTYAEVLHTTGDDAVALSQLQSHIKIWSDPEAYWLLADLQANQGDKTAAKTTLEAMVLKIKGFAPFRYRKTKHFIAKGERKLKDLSKA